VAADEAVSALEAAHVKAASATEAANDLRQQVQQQGIVIQQLQQQLETAAKRASAAAGASAVAAAQAEANCSGTGRWSV